jgi:hypothetical protein
MTLIKLIFTARPGRNQKETSTTETRRHGEKDRGANAEGSKEIARIAKIAGIAKIENQE